MVKRIGTTTTKAGKTVATYEVPCPRCSRVRVIKRKDHALRHVQKICKFCSSKDNHPRGEHRGFRVSWWRKYELSAKTRGLSWELTIDDGVDLYEQQEGKCAFTGISLVCTGDFTKDITASLDRIDNSQGYVRGNVQFVHKDVNMMRGHLPMERFVELCKAVAGSK